MEEVREVVLDGEESKLSWDISKHFIPILVPPHYSCLQKRRHVQNLGLRVTFISETGRPRLISSENVEMKIKTSMHATDINTVKLLRGLTNGR